MRKQHENLRVWQSAYALTLLLYRIAAQFPNTERFGLMTQLRRAAVSIPSNIAEGQGRRSVKQNIHFLGIARGSLLELQTQIALAQDLGYMQAEEFQRLDEAGESLARQLNALIAALERSSNI